MSESADLYFGGAWQAGSGERLRIHEPATGVLLRELRGASRADVGRAVASAVEGFRAWRDTPVLERARILRCAATLLRQRAAELGELETRNTGNPIAVMVPEVGACADFMEFFAGLGTEMKGVTIPISSQAFSMTMREPLGVVARICAFNHPLLYATAKSASALIAGNAVIVKPSDLTPLTALRVAELWHGLFPPGVFNVLPGTRETGDALVADPGVAKVALIGSPAAGRAVMAAGAATLKGLTLELGGKNALVACADADPEAVAEAVVRGMNFRSVTGQSCGSTSRVYLHEAIHDAVVERVVGAVSRLRVGLPTDPRTEVGALSSQAQFDKTLGHIELARAEGARIAAGGMRPTDPALADGFFVQPTVLVNVTDAMRVAREEVFGPVLSLLRWREEEDVIARVNASPFGLTAAVFSNDFSRAHRFAARLQAGYVWINDSATHTLGVPFGGTRQSGFGREESLEEVLEFTCSRTINVKLLDRAAPSSKENP